MNSESRHLFIKERGGPEKLEANLKNLTKSMEELELICRTLSEKGAFSMIKKFFRNSGQVKKLKEAFD